MGGKSISGLFNQVLFFFYKIIELTTVSFPVELALMLVISALGFP